MRLRARDKRPTPLGVASAMDVSSFQERDARLLRGFLPGRHGTLFSSHLMHWANSGSADVSDMIGMFWYRDHRNPTLAEYAIGQRTRDRLVTVGAMSLTVWAVQWRGAHDVPSLAKQARLSLAAPLPHQEHEAALFMDYNGKPDVQSVQVLDEVFFCVGPGSRVRRFYADDDGIYHLHDCGIQPPKDVLEAETDMTWIGTEEDDGGLPWDTDIAYRVFWVDERYRWSSPSDTLDHNTGTLTSAGSGTTCRVKLTLTWPDDEQVKYAVIGRAALGTLTFMSFVPDGYESQYIERGTEAVVTVIDVTTEANLLAGERCPLPGQNDPPNPASCMAIHGQRLWLNDRSYGAIVDDVPNHADEASQARVQVSNTGGLTQFNRVADIDEPALGTSIDVGSDSGDKITALGPIGSLLGVWKGSSFHYITGTDPSTWTVEYGAAVGCAGASALAYVRGVPYWLAEDGVYTLSGAMQPINVSLRVANYFGGAQKALVGSVEATG